MVVNPQKCICVVIAGKVCFHASAATRHLPRRAGEAKSRAFPVKLLRFHCRKFREDVAADDKGTAAGWGLPNDRSDVDLNQADNQDKENQHGKHELKIGFQGGGHFQSGSGIGLFQIVVEAPAPARHAEEQVCQRTQREQ